MSSRRSIFFDYKYSTSHGAVFSDLPRTFSVFSNSQFLKLFEVSKTKRRYRCLECIYNGDRDFEFYVEEGHKTAVLIAADDALKCLMCGGKFRVSRKKCKMKDCRSMVIADNDDDFVGYCHQCGYDQARQSP